MPCCMPARRWLLRRSASVRLLFTAVLGSIALGAFLHSAKHVCDDYRQSNMLSCSAGLWPGTSLLAPQLSCQQQQTPARGPLPRHSIIQSDGCIHQPDGRLVCGLWVLPSGFIGRTGNQLVQMLVQQYLAQCINYVFASPSSVVSVGEPSMPAETQCASGTDFPRSWAAAPSVHVESKAASNALLLAIANKHQLPSIIKSTWYWERGDVLVAALERQKWDRNSAVHAMTPNLLAAAYAGILKGKQQPPSSHSDAADKATRFLADDPDNTILVHIRAGDLVDFTLQREFMRRRGFEAEDMTEWTPGRRPLPGSRAFAAMEDFIADMRDHPLPNGARFFNWDYAKAAHGMDLLEITEYDCATNDEVSVTPPIWFFQKLLSNHGQTGGALWQHVIVLAEPGNEAHPIVAAIVREFDATLVTIDSVADSLAMFMAARNMVMSSSTLSQVGGLLGRATTVHLPHVGLDTLRPDHDTCRLPLIREPGSGAAGPFRDLSGGPQIVYHDVLRACINNIMEHKSDWSSRMQVAHGWNLQTLGRCMQRHGNAGPFFLNSTQLIAFYRDPDCARVFMPSAIAAQHDTPMASPRLCVDDFQDWKGVCAHDHG